MMSNIQVLDQTTINQIAAGEVIERPASVVKELLENAIDAKATAVTIEIKEGGISFIRITDNGCGIAKEEIPLAFLRHSTSKIRSVEDLMVISSLGFRGEALSSVAAVSQVELITKVPASLNGSRYCIEGGTEKSLEEIGCPEGTTFLVRNLFYNTPARRKFLKTAQTEAGYISDIIEKIALSHPEVSIRFINNNQSRLHTSGNHNLKDIIYHIYGRDIVANLLPIDASMKTEAVSIRGFIGKPIISRGNRGYENYYINGRYIKSSLISKAIEDAYQSFLMQHKYPFTVLHIQMDAKLLDVNVHPTKMDLRIGEEEAVYTFLYETIFQALSSRELVTEMNLEKKKKKREEIVENTTKIKEKVPEPLKQNQIIKEQKIKETAVYKTGDEKTVSQNKSIGVEVPSDSNNETKIEKKIQESQQLNLFDGKLLSKEAREPHRIIGQVFETYWLVEYQNQLFLIDQHAAHEKVLYEKTITALQTQEYTSQILNPPIILTLSMQEEELLNRFRGYFKGIGFEIEYFGGREYAIRTVPNNLFGIAEKEIFLELLDELAREIPLQGVENTQAIYEKVASMSCKAAVKGKQKLSEQEAQALIEALMELENPYHCPHGRPTIVVISRYEIEKKFKRIL